MLPRIADLDRSVFSNVFPGSQMPWNENLSLQLQDMYDQVYSHLIRASKHQRTTLQILGQIILAQGTPANMDTSAPRPNASSPKLLVAILNLWHRIVMLSVTDLGLLLEVGNEDEDIRIRHPSFVEFLLDRARSQELFVDIQDAAQLLLQNTSAIIGRIFDNEGMCIPQLTYLLHTQCLCLFAADSPKSLQSCL